MSREPLPIIGRQAQVERTLTNLQLETGPLLHQQLPQLGSPPSAVRGGSLALMVSQAAGHTEGVFGG